MKGFAAPLTGVVALLSVASADPIKYCPNNANNVCYSVGIPSSSASSDSGNIYFQISAPTTYQWVALGTGTGMSGSNIFLIFQNGQGNLTLSPRRGTFHTEPPVDTSSTGAKLTLLAGSGVSSDGKTMVANVKCSNCQSWSGGGSMQLSSTSANWVSAWKKGDSLASTSASTDIDQHDDTAVFDLDLTKASISSDSNPFAGSSSSSSGTGSGSGSGNGSGSGSGSGSDSGSDGSSSGVSVVSASPLNPALLTAHGIIMAIVMVALFPLGAMLMPLLGRWYIHAAFQTLAFCLMWVGFALGVICAKERNLLFKQAHTVFGTIIICLMVIQPFLGLAHHRFYLKHQRRGAVSHAHIWYGRALIAAGIVNGGLGLQLAGASMAAIIAYAVVAVVVALCYAISSVLLSIRKTRRSAHGGRRHKEGEAQPTPPQVPRKDHVRGAHGRDAEHARYQPQEGYQNGQYR